jgi:hypothetical protein
VKTKLKRACKAWASQTIHGYWQASPASFGAEPCYIVPAAEYERLAKVDKLAGRLMQHAACITSHKRCSATSDIVDKLMRVASEPTARKK